MKKRRRARKVPPPTIDHVTAKPWLVSSAVRWLDEHLRPTMVGIEYGGGSSTPWLCARLKKLYTVDANASWSIAMIKCMNKSIVLLKKWRLIFINSDWQIGPDGSRCGYKNKRLESISNIDKDTFEADYTMLLSEITPDFILVDGAIRRRILPFAIRRLKSPGGILVVDNTETMAKGKCGADAVVPKEWIRHDFSATASDKIPSWQNGKWITSIFISK